MRSPSLSTWLLTAAQIINIAFAQTSTSCNPLQQSCPPDPALGTSEFFDFTKGASSGFSAQGAPTYNSNGAQFTVAKSGDAPTIISNWYIMFGHVDVVLQAAPGVGIVSSMVLQSNDLDEIDLEWLGADNTQVQSNYFGKGQTTTYNRGAFHPNPNNQNGFNTYSVDWTADQIEWQINGNTVRVLTAADAETNQYPQTPMQLKLGVWSGGDPSNAPGTIAWAGGPTNYAAGPFTMQVQSVKAIDYSTGKEYTYGDMSGSWQTIKSEGGTINSSGSGGDSSAVVAAPPVTSVSNGAPMPLSGTNLDPTSTFTTPDVYPWVTTAASTQSAPVTTYPGLPSGWTVNPSGKVVPPSAAPSASPPASSTPSSVALQSASSLSAVAGYEVVTTYNQQGFLTIVTEQAGPAVTAPSPTTAPSSTSATPSDTTVTNVGLVAANVVTSSSSSALLTIATGAANSKQQMDSIGAFAVFGIVAGALIL